MNFYQDITLLPDSEANLGFLWQKVFTQVHIALADNKMADGHSAIAVAFPRYKDKAYPLGDQLRLFSETEQQLETLNINKWLNRLTDYTHLKSIKPVPSSVNEFALFKRQQIKSNIERKALRRAKHLNKPYDEVLAFLQAENEQAKKDIYQSKLPFIQLESLSSANKHKYKIFIECERVKNAIKGSFTCYGLSKTATVPWF